MYEHGKTKRHLIMTKKLMNGHYSGFRNRDYFDDKNDVVITGDIIVSI